MVIGSAYAGICRSTRLIEAWRCSHRRIAGSGYGIDGQSTPAARTRGSESDPDKGRSPTRHVSDVLGIQRWQLRVAIHKIKARSNLGPPARIIIHSDGKVTDIHGAEIGNVLDEI